MEQSDGTVRDVSADGPWLAMRGWGSGAQTIWGDVAMRNMLWIRTLPASADQQGSTYELR
jgi:hypothetical protein